MVTVQAAMAHMNARFPQLFYLIVGLSTVGCARTDVYWLEDVAQVTVEPVYAGAADWNAYVRRDDASRDVFHQSALACAGTEVGHSACFHAGELRQAVVNGVSSCGGLTARDALGAFSWSCEDSSGTAVFYAHELAEGRGLRDLVTSDGFRDNHLTIERGAAMLTDSSPAAWWSNPVLPLPANAGEGVAVLDVPGAIYVADSTQSTDGYNMNADGVGLVSLEGVTLAFTGGANCLEATGELGTDKSCLLAAGTQRFLWLEASLTQSDGAATYVALLRDVSFSRVHHAAIDGSTASAAVGVAMHGGHGNVASRLNVRGMGGVGVSIRGSDWGLWRDITISTCGDAGVFANGVDDSIFRGLRLVNNTGHGAYVYNGHRNALADAVISNTRETTSGSLDGVGFELEDSSDNVVTRVLLAHNQAEHNFMLFGASANTVTHVSTTGGPHSAFSAWNSSQLTIAQILAVGSGDGIYLGGDTTNTQSVLSHLVAAHVADGLGVSDGVQHRFTGHVWLGGISGAPCFSSGTQPGLINGTCTDTGLEGSSTYTDEQSDAVLHIDRDYTGSFVGRVLADDLVNGSDLGGAAAYDGGLDWVAVANPFRAWGRDGTGFVVGACVASETCRIWDWRVAATDTTLRDVNGVFTPSAACPASASGDIALADKVALTYNDGIVAAENSGDGIGNDDGVCESDESCHDVFLVNATELFDDDTGDDDGLCESGERCVYSPNIGAYQGEGELTAPCVFADGVVHGVELRAFAASAAP